MPLPEPEELQMILNLKAALLLITVAGGYYHDLSTDAVRLDANANIEQLIGDSSIRPFVLIDVLPETRSYTSSRGPNRLGTIDIVTPVNVHWVNEPTDPDDETRLTEFFRATANIEKAIARDITLGGTARDTRVLDRTLDHSMSTSAVWAITRLELSRQRVYGAP